MAAITFKLFEPTPPLSIAQYRARARKRLPDMMWAFLDGGADDLVTLERNQSAFRRWRLRQRVLTGTSAPSLSTTMAGAKVSLPVVLAPTGVGGLFHWHGEPASFAAAERAGTRAILSTGTSYAMEDVAAAVKHPHWFQLYPAGDRDYVGGLIDRARAAGYGALFVTVDVPVMGNREGERTSGMGMPVRVTPKRFLNLALHPRWSLGTLCRGRMLPVHLMDQYFPKARKDPPPRFMQSDLNWDDLKWMRDRWPGPFYLKGILDAEDAVRAVDGVGATGVVVSNHGGRQLDRALASVEALPKVVAAIGDRAEVFLDGGIRRGTDVITALCLGAKGVLIGRPYLYGLAVDGGPGVERVLEILKEEMKRDLILMGCPDVARLDRSWLVGEDEA